MTSEVYTDVLTRAKSWLQQRGRIVILVGAACRECEQVSDHNCIDVKCSDCCGDSNCQVHGTGHVRVAQCPWCDIDLELSPGFVKRHMLACRPEFFVTNPKAAQMAPIKLYESAWTMSRPKQPFPVDFQRILEEMSKKVPSAPQLPAINSGMKQAMKSLVSTKLSFITDPVGKSAAIEWGNVKDSDQIRELLWQRDNCNNIEEASERYSEVCHILTSLFSDAYPVS